MYLPQSGATAFGKMSVTLWISRVHAAVYPCKLVLMDLGKQQQQSTLTAAAASDFGKYTFGFRLIIDIIGDKKEETTHFNPGSPLRV